MSASIRPILGRRLAAALATSGALLLLAACGGGMGYSASPSMGGPPPSGSACNSANCGAAMITMTDAKGDFLSYIVSLTSLQLQTADGTMVETIPATTKVDFAQLVDLSEVLTAGQIPVADYVSAKLTIDYANSKITADDGTGHPVTLSPMDASGAPITGTLTVTVQLDNAHHLHITAGQIARLALDFNLGVSNTVDMMADTVTVAPTLVASVAPSDVTPLRARGSLASVSTSGEDFVINIMPFHDEDQEDKSGQVTVQVGSSTRYQINGTAYSGNAGLTALAAVGSGTKVAAFGTVQEGNQPSFTATMVLAGSSLERAGEDSISGTVIARSQTTLTVRDATWSGSDGDFDFETKDATVMIGPATVVTEEGHAGSFSIADISPGQKVDASGSVSKGSDGAVTVDSTAGEVDLDVTRASGIVTLLSDGSLTLNLESLGGLPTDVFDFSGTGSSTANDASPSAYVVNTGTLTQSGLSVNSSALALGFVTGFGTAPPDFNADTLITAPSIEADLRLRFGRHGSTTVFTDLTSSSTSLVIDLSSLGTSGDCNSNDGGNSGGTDGGDGSSPPMTTVHDQGPGGNDNSGPGSSNDCNDNSMPGSSGGDNGGSGDDDGNDPIIEIGDRRIDVRQLATLTVVPDTQGDDSFTIGHANVMMNENFSTFSAFVSQLSSDLNGGSAVIAVTASGRFDTVTGTFTATSIAVLLSN
ncbi:MAG TPA: hypothetical protein VFW10_06200 [Steroidobacteraceae bacterium]|nr:hypothetical protein [Steroidobacteraceae bacterium]